MTKTLSGVRVLGQGSLTGPDGPAGDADQVLSFHEAVVEIGPARTRAVMQPLRPLHLDLKQICQL